MTQRLLIDLNGMYTLYHRPVRSSFLFPCSLSEASIKRQKQDSFLTFTRTIESAPDVSRAIRAQFETNKEEVWTEPSLDAPSSAERGRGALGVQVRIERTLQVEDHPWLLEREMCRPRRAGTECATQGSWSTATHNTRDDEIRAMRDPMMVTIR